MNEGARMWGRTVRHVPFDHLIKRQVVMCGLAFLCTIAVFLVVALRDAYAFAPLYVVTAVVCLQALIGALEVRRRLLHPAEAPAVPEPFNPYAPPSL